MAPRTTRGGTQTTTAQESAAESVNNEPALTVQDDILHSYDHGRKK